MEVNEKRPASVSVVIPVRGRDTFLQEALESCEAQTFRDFEVLVERDERGEGPAAARNRAARRARGASLAFLDSDDLWLPKKLAVQVAAMDRTGAAVSQTQERWLRNGKPLAPLARHRKSGGWIYERCLDLCLVSPSAAMIRRDVFLELGGFDEDFFVCEDYEFWLRVSLAFPILLIEEPLVVKRGGHADQLSGAFAGFDAFRIRALAKTLAREPLSLEQREKTLATLGAKAKIYSGGARKRGRLQEASFYEGLAERCRVGAYPARGDWPPIPDYEAYLAGQNLR